MASEERSVKFWEENATLKSSGNNFLGSNIPEKSFFTWRVIILTKRGWIWPLLM